MEEQRIRFGQEDPRGKKEGLSRASSAVPLKSGTRETASSHLVQLLHHAPPTLLTMGVTTIPPPGGPAAFQAVLILIYENASPCLEGSMHFVPRRPQNRS